MQVSGLGIPPVIAATAVSAGGSFLSKMFGGGGDVNYANNFSAQVGIGKKYLQTEADAYYSRSSRLGVGAADIARMEYQAGRALPDNEILALAGKAPVTAYGQPPMYPEAFTNPFGPASAGYAPGGFTMPLPLLIGGVALLSVGAVLLLRRK